MAMAARRRGGKAHLNTPISACNEAEAVFEYLAGCPPHVREGDIIRVLSGSWRVAKVVRVRAYNNRLKVRYAKPGWHPGDNIRGQLHSVDRRRTPYELA